LNPERQPDDNPSVTRAEKTRREVRTLLFFLAGLEMVAIVLLVVGLVVDNDSLKVASYALGMPITFALIGNLGLYLTWTGKNSR
jgi:hypothetical protein